MRWLLLALAGLALAGCQSTQEESARLEKAAKLARTRAPLGTYGLKIAKPSASIHASAVAIRGSEGTDAVVVTLHNQSASTQVEVPIAVAVHGTGGAQLYTNTGAGVGRALVSSPLVPAHATATWVDDQVQAEGTPASVTVTIGEGKRLTGTAPQIVLSGSRLQVEGSTASATGTVTNRSSVEQHELIVDAVARRGGTVLAAGRAVLAALAPGASSPFQAFLIGKAGSGATLSVTTAPSTLG